ncbi:ABC transporter substrate-binding protein [Acuticoccus sediminis]|uniref:ABC transporter substrate-binding protein n=1 Tax=Acuticoccus sediminis TaxID=2184697 RepID=A0A8B2NNV1_9HYPH|nr:ABC transporter substrate-binding protein [Acuticoccus sediminis]RAH98359.1 ABC transporter substrate-binding protein [Acuticoccus sediminis]
MTYRTFGRPTRRTVLRGAAAGAAVLAAPAILRAQGSTIRIGMPTILSGRVAILGQSSEAAAQLAVSEANEAGGIDGRMLELVVRDSAGKPDQATKVTRDLVNTEGCSVILDAEASGGSFAVNETVRDIKVYCIHTNSETSELTAAPKNQVEWVFRCARQGIHDAVGGGLYAANLSKEKGLTRWGTCSPDYAYGRSNTAEFMEYTKRFAPEIEVVVESWPKIFQPDYTENITALLNSAPQALYSCLWGGDLVAFFDQASLYGLFDQFETVAVNLGDYPVLEAIKALPTGIHSGSRYSSTVPDTEANRTWNDTYRAHSPVLPTNWAWQTYSGIKFMVEALKATGGDTDASKLAEATRGMTIDSPFGVNGTLTLRESDHTLIDYPVGYGLTLPEPPYIKNFQMTAWDEILKYEAEWKERNGYA